MMIDGLSHLKTLRSQKIVPRTVTLSVDCKFTPPKYEHEFAHMELTVCAPVERDDFRVFVGLHVTLFCKDYDQFAAKVFDRLKQHAAEITVLVAKWGEDIGFFWSAEYGQMELCEIGWLEQYFAAKGMVCRNQKEVEQRIRLETEALSHLNRKPLDYSNGNIS
jgi:hypothetical protein